MAAATIHSRAARVCAFVPSVRTTFAGRVCRARVLLAGVAALLTCLTSALYPARATVRETPTVLRVAPLIPVDRVFAAPFRSPQDCRRWRAVAARLGETYAGFRLRQTIVARACAFAEDVATDETWSWPWRESGLRVVLPPTVVSNFGSWQIRCGPASGRSRCILAVTSALEGSPDPDTDDLPLVAHFVIDQVGGREVLLWRLHVVADVVHSGGLEVMLAKRRSHETFDVCGRVGCIVETETRLSAEAANWLWDGKAVGISLGGRGPGALTATLPAGGFRAGLSELMRRRRLESSSLAGR